MTLNITAIAIAIAMAILRVSEAATVTRVRLRETTLALAWRLSCNKSKISMIRCPPRRRAAKNLLLAIARSQVGVPAAIITLIKLT